MTGGFPHHTMSPRQIGGGFSVSRRKPKGLHEEFWITGLYCFVTRNLHIGESSEMHYRYSCSALKLRCVKVALRKTGGGIAMTDVVEIANERRDALAAGIDRLAAENEPWPARRQTK